MTDLDRESIEIRLEKLRKCLVKLEPLSKISEEEFINNEVLHDIAERNLQLAIQCCLDIGSHLIAIFSMKRPEDYQDIFCNLGQGGVIPEEFAKEISPMAGLRNILVHEYLDIKLSRIHEVLQRLDDFKKFAQYIVEFINKADK